MLLSGAKQMKDTDTAAINDGTGSLWLMENASAHLADAAYKYIEKGGSALIFCGSGNNGGDGMGAAIELRRRGCDTRVILCGSWQRLSPDMAEMYRRYAAMGGEVESFVSDMEPGDAGVIIDALFGIGLNKPLRGSALGAVEFINASGIPVVAADIASGIEADTGRILGNAVKATETVTFSMAKPGHFAEPGNIYTGRLSVADIGIPEKYTDSLEVNTFAICDGDVSLPARKPLSHKGDHGKLLIIAGSKGYSGAPNMASLAAVRSGAGLVWLGVPDSIYEICAVKNLEAMPFPLGTEPVRSAMEKLAACSVCVIGPGMGRSSATKELVRAVLEDFEGTVIADADAIWAIGRDMELLRRCRANIVLTPHEGEFAFLGGSTAETGRIATARAFAQEWGCTLVLKGHRTIAAYADGEVYITTHGNAGMAKGGSGDVLAGVLGAMAAQFPLKQAVNTGLYLHSLAGDIARDEFGEYSMRAGDIIEMLPCATMSIIKEK